MKRSLPGFPAPVLCLVLAFCAAPPPPLAAQVFPLSYDIRDNGWMTSVKDQGQCGSCWAFATMASIESNILAAGGPAMDLSENNLKNNHGFPAGPCDGGDFDMSTACLSRLGGPVLESQDPYHDYDDAPSPSYTPSRFLSSVEWPDTVSEYKSAIMTRGAAAVAFAFVDSAYDATDATYYLDHVVEANHAVALVGWDDSRATRSPNPGAWLLKNSWGAGWGDAGYFWISYDDPYFNGTATINNASFETLAMPSGVSLVHHGYDRLGCSESMSGINGVGALFTAGPSEEHFYRLGFYTLADGASYTLSIYDTWDPAMMEPSGEIFSSGGTMALKGYHTIDAGPLAPGVTGEFFVQLSLTGSDYAYDKTATGTGQTFFWDGNDWVDLNGKGDLGAFCLKAFTTAPIPEPSVFALLPGLAAATAAWLRRRGRRGG